MTVEELIEELGNHHPDLVVYVPSQALDGEKEMAENVTTEENYPDDAFLLIEG